MRRFKWTDGNLSRIEAHDLSVEAVEAALDRVFSLKERRDGSFPRFATTPTGRRVWVIWRNDTIDDLLPDVFDEFETAPIFVITAY